MKNQKNKSSTKKGFTLIELVVVIGILTVLLTIVLVAINPSRQFKQANDTKRKSDVSAILNAVSQYAAENKGSLSALSLTTTLKNISDTATDANICSLLVPTYISALPVDPSQTTSQTVCASGYNTHYSISADASGRVTVSAPDTELVGHTEDISNTR